MIGGVSEMASPSLCFPVGGTRALRGTSWHSHGMSSLLTPFNPITLNDVCMSGLGRTPLTLTLTPTLTLTLTLTPTLTEH